VTVLCFGGRNHVESKSIIRAGIMVSVRRWYRSCRSAIVSILDFPPQVPHIDRHFRFARVRRLGITGLQLDDYFVAFGGAWYTILTVAFNQMLIGGGSNLLTEDEIALLTPQTIADRVEGSKWVFVSEHAMLLTIWSMKAAMLCLYARITSGSNLIQRRLLKGVAIWVVIAFIGDELALFTICRPVSQYWAVPADNRKRFPVLPRPKLTIVSSMLDI
jgi:hypothetical protein